MARVSPCVRVCRMDDSGLSCVGCGRTRDEIAIWSMISDEQALAVIAALPSRDHMRNRSSSDELDDSGSSS
ncbi:MAG: DUF1289 domain-containing protein [Actinomycetota bacterium]|jgi:predicted Fe-S protein YdhL (DUF1289 family)|nr:DUF1289 domain-containing protein [Actinomycetota bacterium]MDA3015564.1 DUF1289 domain-containing protein [Actinomycetota bacterium]MDA3029261.1 DUF1289 domain-containing protein [Actinomycetota bacterium]